MQPRKRTTGRKLMQWRKAVLSANPLCVTCARKGRITQATEVDHTVPLFKGGEDGPRNMQGLCHECHADKTRDDMGWRERPQIGLDGWPVDG